MNLTDKLKAFKDAFSDFSVDVYHYWRPKRIPPYIVWQEDGGENFSVDNCVGEQSLTGTLDYFTKTECDPVIDEIQATLNILPIAWQLNSVQYEDDTNMIHYEWTWRWL